MVRGGGAICGGCAGTVDCCCSGCGLGLGEEEVKQEVDHLFL